MSTPSGVVKVGRVGYCEPTFQPFRCDRNTNSPLKNPFGGKHSEIGSHEASIQAFSDHFSKQMSNVSSKVRIAVRRLLRRLKKGENILLQCHCCPDTCHCDVIKQYLDEELG